MDDNILPGLHTGNDMTDIGITSEYAHIYEYSNEVKSQQGNKHFQVIKKVLRV